MALSVFNVLDAATVSQKLSQRGLAFHIGPASEIVAVEHQEIESTSAGTFIVDPTVQRVEVRNPIQPNPDNLSVKNCVAFDMCRSIDNHRIAFRPVGSVHGVEAHPAIADMDLQPVAVMLQLMRPARSRWGLLGDGWLARVNESSRRIDGLPRELRIRHNMRVIYCKNRNGATLQTLFSGPRLPGVPPIRGC